MTTYQNFIKTTEFAAEVIDADYNGDIVTYCFPGALQNAWVPGVAVHVIPNNKPSWIGHFMQGKESPNAVSLCCTHPDCKSLVVVSHGRGYVVSAKEPSKWEEISMLPIMGFYFDDTTNTLILQNHTRFLGIQSNNSWKTPSLSWDELKFVELKNGLLIGQGWDASISKFVNFEVNVQNGSCTGGAIPPI
jgi:hypothetical protein